MADPSLASAVTTMVTWASVAVELAALPSVFRGALELLTGEATRKDATQRWSFDAFMDIVNRSDAQAAELARAGAINSLPPLSDVQAARAIESGLTAIRTAFDDEHVEAIKNAVARVLAETNDRASAWFWWERLGTLSNMEVRTIRLLDDVSGGTPDVGLYLGGNRVKFVRLGDSETSIEQPAMSDEYSAAIAEAAIRGGPRWWLRERKTRRATGRNSMGETSTIIDAYTLAPAGNRVAMLIRPIGREAQPAA